MNDLYKRYIKPDGTPTGTTSRVSYVAQIVILVVGHLRSATRRRRSTRSRSGSSNGLWGGYTAANVLKWHWYRFNGYGYFWGMLAGIGRRSRAAQASSRASTPLWGFLPIFLISLAASVLGSLLSDPEDDDVLVAFYRQVRPWGFWGPVLAKVRAADPSFHENKDMAATPSTSGVGIIAQMTLVTIPLYMVLRDMKGLWISALVLLVTGWILKKNWYEKLDAETPATLEGARR